MRLSAFLAFACVALVAFVATPRVAHAGWWDDLDKGEQVRLSDLTHEAERWKDKVVTFACVYHGPDTVYQPYFTSFNAEKHLNFTAWYDGAPIWEKKSFTDDDFPYLYLVRNHAQRDELLRIPAYTRIEITGRVKDVYRQRPWIDVLGFRVTPATFGRDVLKDMIDGDAFAANRDYVRAEAHYSRVASQVTLDETTRLRVTKRIADARRAAGKDIDGSPEAKVLGGTSMPEPGSGSCGGLPPADTEPAVPAVSVAPLPAEGTAPSARADALTTDDLPGTPVDNSRAAPAVRSPAPGLPGPVPVPGPSVRDPKSPPAPTHIAPQVPPPPAPDPAAAALSPPPPPPPRSPRLSGVK